MNNYTIGIFLFLLSFLYKPILAQDNCVVKLNEAEKLYENGKIEQIPHLISACIENGFNKEEKIQALRLLTLVYLFEDNSDKAEKTVLQLLKIDPEFKINQAIDPVEFIKLIKSFNTAPVFSFGISASPFVTKPHLIETHSTNGFNEANPQYNSGGVNFSVGIKGIYHINNKWDIFIEPAYSYMSFLVKENTTKSTVTSLNESLSYFSIPLYGSYYFYKIKKYHFFGEAGFSYDMFISGSINGTVDFVNREQSIVPAALSTIEIRKDKNLMGALGAGAKIDMNRSNFQLSVRYKFGVMNVVNTDSRNYKKLFDSYYYIDNDFSINNFCFFISYNREFYIHRKKPNNQTNYDVIR